MKFIIWLLIGYVVYQMFKGRSGGEIPAAQPAEKGEETFRDPVCGVYVSAEDAVIGRHEGERLHFCSMECLEKYQERLENK
ncbi:MAG: YHS domain-containing protein [Geobacter sp.]|nr:YHS domain-containing protein [Geobacter sp.]